MLIEQNLQTDIGALQHQYDLLSQKVQRLGEALAIETDVAEKFKLETQLKQAKEARDQIDLQICDLNSRQLYPYLLKLGYREQERLFVRFIRQYPVSAFLIHGEPEHGQYWLLRRLVLNVIGSIAGKKVVVDLDCMVRSRSIDALWREIARSVGLGRQASPSEIVDRVFQCWQTQNIFLVFNNIDFMPSDYLPELLQNLWLPLVSKTLSLDSTAIASKMLMFMVDKSGSVDAWNMKFAEQPSSDWNSSIPVKLPIIRRFSEDVLIDWIDHEYTKLPTQLTDDMDSSIKTILEKSDDGIPEWALQEICCICECQWSEEWSKL